MPCHAMATTTIATLPLPPSSVCSTRRRRSFITIGDRAAAAPLLLLLVVGANNVQESASSSSRPFKAGGGMDSSSLRAVEAERLRLDSQARQRMAQQAAQAQESLSDDPRAWKWPIRKRIWGLLEAEGVAREPRPVHHRIPNFSDAEAAAAKVASLLEFQVATVIKVNPDTPQRQVRYLVLRGEHAQEILPNEEDDLLYEDVTEARFQLIEADVIVTSGKKLVTPQPRLRTGFFSVLEAHTLDPKLYKEASTMAGVTKYGRPLGINSKFKVQLLVVGSVAVDPATGARLGKGEGFAELEYGILRHLGAIDDSTLIVTSVHDKQLVRDIPAEKLLVHDVPVDIICTPTQIIRTNTSIPKPKGIYWDKLSPQKLSKIKVLRELKKQIEKETGEEISIGADEPLHPLPERKVFNPYVGT